MDSLSGMSAHPRDRQAQVGLWALPVRLKPRLNTSQASQKRGCSFGNPGYNTPSALGLPRWFGAGSPGGIKGYASLNRLAGFLEVALGLTSPPGFAALCSFGLTLRWCLRFLLVLLGPGRGIVAGGLTRLVRGSSAEECVLGRNLL